LSLRGLRKAYEELLAVQDLSLDILHGEVFGFLGPNGAGKTTTIHMICGLLKPDAGEIVILGQPQSERDSGWKSALGLCPETLVIWEGLTCLEQLEFLGQQYDLETKAANRRALELLDVFGLMDKRRKLATTLSSGMKRRLNIALALVHDPKILILDEPQAGLDPQSRILVREYIRSQAYQKTVILTSHEMHEVDLVADRVGIIDHGQMLALDTPEGLKKGIGAGTILEIELAPGHEAKLDAIKAALPPQLQEMNFQDGMLRLRHEASQEVLPDILDALQSADAQIQDMVMRKPTLEDVFIDLTGRSLRE
jgi:ABC-2 type transport system ATP-binding protein